MKNMKIGLRLILSMALALVLLVILAIVFLVGETNIRAGYESVLSGPVEITDAVQNSETEVNSVARLMRDMALSGYNTATVSQIETSIASIDASLDTIRTLYTESDGLGESYIQAVESWQEAFSAIDSALQRGDLDEARRLIETQCTPRLEAAVEQGYLLMERVQEIGNIQNAQISRDIVRDRTLLIVLTVLACVISLLMNIRTHTS